ncbi:protein mono-ADP-ribosyltransferase TIPARP-like [Aulostomus maculatus]
MATPPVTRRMKRTSECVSPPEPQAEPPSVTMPSPSLLLLEVPADVSTSLPVWDAVKAQQVEVAWTVSPYSLAVQLTPVTSEPGKTPLSSRAAVSPPKVVVQQPVLLSLSSPQPLLPQTALGSLVPIFSLPVFITQRQTSTSALKGVSPAIHTPKPCRSKASLQFHTWNSPDILICDRFLLGSCDEGRKCKMHHTPYPFHWQLWCVNSHQWVDISLPSQITLEKVYCDVTRDGVYIKDSRADPFLSFEEMELDDPSRYDGVRRLANSDSQLSNPHFPARWRIYWWNGFSWQEYDQETSSLLLYHMSRKESECCFSIQSQEYKVDFTAMTQTNVTTGFQRDVRHRPAYRAPDSMLPHLRTGTLTDGDPPGYNFNVDPLEDFSSWYPPAWYLASEQDYCLVEVPPGTRVHQRVQRFFYKSLSETKVDTVSITQVQNRLHWDKYQRHKAYMQKQRGASSEPLERHLFHGTTRDAAEDICHNNFDPRVAGVNGTSLGYGSYFATAASLSDNFSAKGEPGGVRHMFLAKVLVGKVSVGQSKYRRPPPLCSKSKRYHLYDACVDSLSQPTMFVVFDSSQCYPYYLIKYRELPSEIEV